MNKVSCPDCEQLLDEDVARCPHCGFPVRDLTAATPSKTSSLPRSRVGRQIAYGLLVALFFISLLIVLMVWYAERRAPGLNP
jgi:hypothetical protein